ncbi:hypothetical protein [Haladaptatus sp. R4]|uniref:hypothetical protein n=1 Tax=Haladaptatus sp. R4 TaxID=1679489 RepID=UPI00123747DA|nr:hypothetical protein [Haladaptatus sp. R4]
MNRRSFNRLFALGGLSLVSGCSHPLPPPKGKIIERSVVGKSGGGQTPLLSVTDDGDGPSVGSVLHGRSIGPGFVLDEELRGKLGRKYGNIGYYLKIRHEGYDGIQLAPADGSVKWYSTPVDQFNTVQIDDFVILATTITDSIGSFHRVVRDGTVAEKKEKPTDGRFGTISPDEDSRYVELKHAFGKTTIEIPYLSSSEIYDEIEVDGSYPFGVKRKTSEDGTPYSYLDSIDPGHGYSVL